MAKGNWAAFSHASKAFDYAGDKLQKHWAELHAGDQEPFPSEARVVNLLKPNPKLAKGATAATIAGTLQDAWRAFHRGDFEKADALGTGLGVLGANVANKAMGIHAARLVEAEKERLARFQLVAERAEKASAAFPSEPNAHYMRAFALGRYSQLLSITKALAQGLAGKVKESLDTTLKLAPHHAEAHLAMSMYHAEIVGKVGGMLARMTYGATSARAEEHFKTAHKLTPDAPIVFVERANALLLLYGDKQEDDAAIAFAKAAKLKPHDAMAALDIAFAKAQLE